MSAPVSDAEKYEVLIQYVESLQNDAPMSTEVKLIAAFLPELIKTMYQHSTEE